MKNLDQIIEGCQKGNSKAQSLLYKEFAPRLFALTLRYVEEKKDAEDILHDTFIKVYEKIKSFKPGGSFEAWLKRIFVNDSLKFLRNKRNNTLFFDSDRIEEIEDDRLPSEDQFSVKDMILNTGFSKDELLKLLLELPDGYRVVFNLYYFEQFTHKEIAALLGCSVNTSKTQLFKAKKVLQAKLYQMCVDKEKIMQETNVHTD